MKITVNNVRGVKAVEIEAKALTLIAGPNGAGKTSVTQAVARLLAGAPLPPGITKKYASVMVRDGQKSGSVVVDAGGAIGKLSWPDCEARADGVLPRCSMVAAGLLRPARSIGKDSREAWADLLKVQITSEDFRKAVLLDDLKVPEGSMGRIVAQIDTDGAAATWEAVKARATELKAKWSLVSGAGTWGAKKGEDFAPDGLDTELHREAAVARRDQLNGLVRQGADDAVAKAALREARKERVAGLASEKAGLAKAKEALVGLNDALAALPRVNLRHPIPCPHCGRGLDFVPSHGGAQHQVVKATVDEDLPPDVVRERRAALQAAETAVKVGEREVSAAEGRIANIEADAAWLAKNPEITQEEIDRKRRQQEELSSLTTALLAFDKWREAKGIHDAIMLSIAVCDLLDPKGKVAAQKAAQVVEHANRTFEAVCVAGGFPPLVIAREEDGSVSVQYDGRPYPVLSAGEMCAADVIIQLGVAMLDGSGVIVIDGVEAMDGKSWNNLFGVVAEHPEWTVLAAYTQVSRKKTPQLHEHGMGLTVWMERGEVVA